MIPWTDQRMNLLLIFTFYFKYLKYKIIFNLVIETVLYLKYNRINPFTAVYNARNTLGEIRLFWCYYGVTYNFIQNLHQIFSCLFETFGSMSEIMFSSDSMSKIFFFNSWKYMNFYFRLQHHCFGMVGKQWFKNVRMTGISSFTTADSNQYQLSSLDFQNNLYFKETQQTNATIACHL